MVFRRPAQWKVIGFLARRSSIALSSQGTRRHWNSKPRTRQTSRSHKQQARPFAMSDRRSDGRRATILPGDFRCRVSPMRHSTRLPHRGDPHAFKRAGVTIRLLISRPPREDAPSPLLRDQHAGSGPWIGPKVRDRVEARGLLLLNFGSELASICLGHLSLAATGHTINIPVMPSQPAEFTHIGHWSFLRLSERMARRPYGTVWVSGPTSVDATSLAFVARSHQ